MMNSFIYIGRRKVNFLNKCHANINAQEAAKLSTYRMPEECERNINTML
jgi:hypothetical protein